MYYARHAPNNVLFIGHIRVIYRGEANKILD